MILLDEVEKAHSDVFNIPLQGLDDQSPATTLVLSDRFQGPATLENMDSIFCEAAASPQPGGTTMRLFTLCYAVIVLGSLSASNQASAATALRNHFSHGTANCQSALPVFDGNIRKRPMAVANEGSSTAFLTCDSENNEESFGGMQEVGVYFTNRSGANGLTVSCTLVNGAYSGTFFPKSTAAILTGGYGNITWTSADNGGVKFGAPAVSCGLPAGVEINYVNFVYPEEVGP